MAQTTQIKLNCNAFYCRCNKIYMYKVFSKIKGILQMHKHFQHVLDDIHNFSFYTHLNPTSSIHRTIGNKSQINRLLTKGEENETQTTWN